MCLRYWNNEQQNFYFTNNKQIKINQHLTVNLPASSADEDVVYVKLMFAPVP